MKKLLYLLLLTPIIYLASCSKSNVTPQSQSLEDVIVGTEWCLSNANEDGFLLAEDGKFYLTEKCQSNTPIGNWVIDGDLIKYQFTDSTQEITIVWGEVTEYSESQIKLLDYSDSLITITEVYILDTADIYGCMDNTAANYNPAAECSDQASCLYIIPGCTDSTACNYNSIANTNDGSCLTDYGCTDPTATNYNPSATCNDGSCIGGVDIGDVYQGGIVFYVDGNGGGLIAAFSVDQFQANWYDAIDICNNLTTGGYNDWFLPGEYSMSRMYSNIGQGNVLGLGNIGGFDNAIYWTSEYFPGAYEDGVLVEEEWWAIIDFAWNGQVEWYGNSPGSSYNVRAARAF